MTQTHSDQNQKQYTGEVNIQDQWKTASYCIMRSKRVK